MSIKYLPKEFSENDETEFGTGYMAIRNKSEKKRYAIAGILLSAAAVILAIVYTSLSI